MAWFRKRSQPPAVDWGRVEIDPHPHFGRHAQLYPESFAVVDEATRRSGVPIEEVDRVKCVTAIWDLIVRQGLRHLQGEPGAAQGLQAVGQRDDLDDALLWEFFTHHGAPGIAARNRLVEQFTSGAITRGLADRIARGELRVDLGGRHPG